MKFTAKQIELMQEATKNTGYTIRESYFGIDTQNQNKSAVRIDFDLNKGFEILTTGKTCNTVEAMEYAKDLQEAIIILTKLNKILNS